jgi:triacylglycerol lipase
MQSRSALARLQQFTTLGTLLCAAAWLAWHWQDSRVTGWIGFLLIVMGYSVVLAIEFVALRFAGRLDPAPQPTWPELGRAWIAETIAAPTVFCWRQPFRWREIPDRLQAAPGASGQRGAVFIHGFVCNRGFWIPWLMRMRELGRPFLAVNLEPVFGSIDAYVPIIEDAVKRITAATGRPPVLVCHSMGGLAARAWLRAKSADERVHHVITIASPHHGTWLGQFSHLENGRQMSLRGPWVRELQQSSDPVRNSRFTCWYTNCDNIVFPASTATLPGADNRLVRGVAHVELAFHREVMDESLAKITALD